MKSKQLFFFILLFVSFINTNANAGDTTNVYKFDIKEEINPAMWRVTKQSIEAANKINADLILIHMNTYGGLVESADSIRTAILNCDIPVYVFIDNNAASAGALISIACDRIYMRSGANIGAATVVDQTGGQMPDKYQSYMRSMMRSTAEAHGKDTIINGNDTTFRWKRNPKVAEAMVDERLKIIGVSDSGQVLTFTATEALANHFCEGIAEDIPGVLKLAGIENYTITEHYRSPFEKLMGMLMSPWLKGFLIMIIVAGIYFELQTPGVGFPLAAAITAAIIYFAPAYLEGLAEHWEILMFIVGLVLLAIEIFAIPGFGVAGIAGITLMVVGLALSMVDNVGFEFSSGFLVPVLRAFLVVVFSMFASLIISIYFSKQILTTNMFGQIALNTVQNKSEGYIGVENLTDTMTGREGVAITMMRPIGKIEIDGIIYDATAITGYIEKDVAVKVIRYETGQLYVKAINQSR